MPNRAAIVLCAALLGLTLRAGPAFPAPPADRAAALAGLGADEPARRAEAIAWIADHGAAGDAELLYPRLRDDSALVRSYAESALWMLWSRSGDPALDELLARGVEQMNNGRPQQAIATFSKLIRRRPSFTEAWNKRATAYFLTGKYRESIADCQQVLKRNPRHFGALSGLGQIYLTLQDYEQALAWFRRAFEVDPNLEGVELDIKALEEILRQRRARTI
ncbi:MAG TPA: tetratricopeptide repeat protein [Burkholderiales bacterium]|nr:tetratricopeptide repeat protein [Burkholderiales bacterium]